MKEFQCPLKKHDWMQKWCVDVHNILASQSLSWRTPYELKNGHTPDISSFRFYVWEAIWYFDGVAKVPEPSFKKGRWLGFAWSAGDAFTYFIETERPVSEGRPMVLIRSIIKTRRKNIGKPTEYIFPSK